MDKIVAVSQCLLGIRCRYDGESKPEEKVIELKETFFLLPFCPEQLGGLPTPREPAKIEKGDGFSVLKRESKVVSLITLTDVTENFLKGATESLKLISTFKDKVTAVILKEKSPSCGVKRIYNFNSDSLKKGCGVTTALLIENGFSVISSEDILSIEQLKRSKDE